MQLGFIFSLIFAIIVTIFALQNSAAVNINFLFANVEVSQALVIFVSAVFGAIIVAILGFYRGVKIKMSLKKSNKQLVTLEDEKTSIQNEKTSVEEENSYLKKEVDSLRTTISSLKNPSMETEVIEKNITESSVEEENNIIE
ncbi:lipopolysaccharide assembly protein LapA domain-containing protein [Clostridium grantii]|uniref:Uncharacterized integral membrane protein n=1 Tax=Clostridium grantii DSM 8605 TaxID=1121316 RepID=A0A1M5XIS2_9CLOT|nr:lipopolysaccharide assembly protein LapA domain-containing protein [Clostridium grantii]SHH99656.1 Uncharacterized integral membrane protein [Clostridium grantii DSM 8605]